VSQSKQQHIPEGYKQTEVGVIPEDWEIPKVSKISIVVDSLHLTPSFTVVGYAMVRVADIKTGNLRLETTLKVSEKVFKEFTRNYHPKRGDIVLSRVGSYGVSSFVDTDEKFCMGQNTVVIQPKVCSKYLYYMLNSVAIWKQIEDGSYGSGYKSLSLKNINDLYVPLANEKEQIAIANALSDVDGLIGSLEKLIVKKRAIKTAAMQQLLTGKKRLPPFDKTHTGYKKTELGEIPNDWDVALFKDLCSSFTTGKLDANAMKPNGKYRFYTCARNHFFIDDYAFDMEALLVSGNGANVGYVHYYEGKFNAYQRTYVLSGFSSDVGYLKLYLEKKLSDRIRVEVNAGSTPYITMDTLTDMVILVPSSKSEEAAIANTLLDMDKEIEALEQRLNKSKQIKQGMMQELLTGKTRLV